METLLEVNVRRSVSNSNGDHAAIEGIRERYSRSNPWVVNLRVRLFSVTVRTI